MLREMKEIGKEEARKLILDILDDVSHFCDDNGLNYTLSNGTLIGAIRHKGFIPWDDDVDINMPRPDYERFIELYSQNGKYKICAVGQTDCPLFHTKVYNPNTIKIEKGVDYKRYRTMGVDIDIFTMDGMPSDDVLYDRNLRYIRKLYKLFYLLRGPRKNIPIKCYWLNMVRPFINTSAITKRYLKIAKQLNYQDSAYVGYYSPFGMFNKDRHRKEVFSDRIKVTFENKTYWAPIGYDEYLHDMYDEYMTLPPLEKQKSHHSFKLYWKGGVL